jgi:hypothetical protein
MRTLLLTAIFSMAVVLAFAAGPQLEIRYVNPAKVADVASNTHVVRGVNYPLVTSRERALGYYKTMYSKTNQSKVIIYVLSEEKKKTELLDMP